MNRPIIKVKIEQLVKAKWNYKTEGSPEIIQKLVKSATYQKSIGILAVREIGKNKYEVIDGNHRLDALKVLGIKEIQVENFGKISKAQAVLISKQRNMIWFEDDNIKFAEIFKNDILKEITIDELEQMLPMSKEELEGLEKLFDFDWQQFNNAAEPQLSDKKTIKIDVTEEVFSMWEQWKNKCEKLLGYKEDSKCFELAIVEALNIPDESLK